jgi:hypothetical protein
VTVVMPEGVAPARDLAGPAMESAISRLTPDVRIVAAYHLGLAVEEIISALSGLGPLSVSERVMTMESIRFGLPKEVRQ